MIDTNKNREIGKKHKLTWIVERAKSFLDAEVVDWWIDHPKECIKECGKESDVEWRGTAYADCAIEFVSEGEGITVFQELIVDMDVDTEGEHSLDFTYDYRYMPPSYPDYEADYDIEITKCPDEKDTTASTAPAST